MTSSSRSRLVGRVVLIFLVCLVAGCSKKTAIKAVPQLDFSDGQYFMLMEPMVYRIGNTSTAVTVPAGFVHDGASIPGVFWQAIPKSGPYNRAAVVHDYLYWAQPCNDRKQVDGIMMLAMKEAGVSKTKRIAVYTGVRVGGWAAWRENEKLRRQGRIRVVPLEARDLPADANWDAYQNTLQAAGHVDPDFEPDNGFCALGSSTNVPLDPPGIPSDK